MRDYCTAAKHNVSRMVRSSIELQKVEVLLVVMVVVVVPQQTDSPHSLASEARVKSERKEKKKRVTRNNEDIAPRAG